MRRKILFSCHFCHHLHMVAILFGSRVPQYVFPWTSWGVCSLVLPPTAPAPRLRCHPANFLHEEGRGLFTAPPEHNWSELHASLFLTFSEVQCLDPIPPLQTSRVVLFALSSGLAQAEAESSCEWCSSVPQLLRTSEELRESTVAATLAVQG